MKKNIIIGIVICLIVVLVLFLIVNKPVKNVNWDIIIYEHMNNPTAGRRKHESNSLLIDSNNNIGKITYIDEFGNTKETKQFKVNKISINKIVELASKGTITLDKNNSEIYTVYEIKIDSKTTYVDSSLDRENVLYDIFNKNNI